MFTNSFHPTQNSAISHANMSFENCSVCSCLVIICLTSHKILKLATESSEFRYRFLKLFLLHKSFISSITSYKYQPPKLPSPICCLHSISQALLGLPFPIIQLCKCLRVDSPSDRRVVSILSPSLKKPKPLKSSCLLFADKSRTSYSDLPEAEVHLIGS